MHPIEKSFIYAPLGVLAASFLVICVHFGTWWPWNTVVHEEGRTLLQTIFYFIHELGELPVEVLISAAVAGAMLSIYGAPAIVGHKTLLLGAGALALALDGAILAGAIQTVGARLSGEYLLQLHTRGDEPMIFGSHWRYHLLSDAALMLLAYVLAGFAAMFVAHGWGAKRQELLTGTWVLFALATAVFGFRESFTDPRFLGHQARELFAHSLVMTPLAIGCCAWVFNKLGPAEPSAVPGVRPVLFWSSAAGAGVIGLYLAIGVVMTRSAQLAQSNDWVKVIFGHFFEHTLSYLVVSAHAVWFYLLGSTRVEATV